MEGLSKHLLDDVNGIKAVRRAVKNILDYGSDARLRKLCEALDVYRERVVLERGEVAAERDQACQVQTELRPEEKQRSGKIQLPPHEQQEYQSRPNLQTKEGAIVHTGKDRASRLEEILQAERRQHDAPLPPSTCSGHAADKLRTDLR